MTEEQPAAPSNSRIAAVLAEIADLLDIKGESSFKVGAYRRAADGTGEAEQLTTGLDPYPYAISPDGTQMVSRVAGPIVSWGAW